MTPPPITKTVLPSAGGAPRSACSSDTSSGTGNTWDRWDTNVSPQLPPVSRHAPTISPGLTCPSDVRRHKLYRPAEQFSQDGTPRAAQGRVGSTVTRCPTYNPTASGPASRIVPTFSWPNTNGNEVRADSAGLVSR